MQVRNRIAKKTYSFVIFQDGVRTSILKKTYSFPRVGVRTSIPKKTYSFVIFQGGGPYQYFKENLQLLLRKPIAFPDFPGWGPVLLRKPIAL